MEAKEKKLDYNFKYTEFACQKTRLMITKPGESVNQLFGLGMR